MVHQNFCVAIPYYAMNVLLWFSKATKPILLLYTYRVYYFFRYTGEDSFTWRNYKNHFCSYYKSKIIATAWQKTTTRRSRVAANYRPISPLLILFKLTTNKPDQTVAGAWPSACHCFLTLTHFKGGGITRIPLHFSTTTVLLFCQ